MHGEQGGASLDLAPSWPDWTRQVRARTTASVVAVGAAGVAMDLVFRHGLATVSGALFVVVAAAGLLTRLENRQAFALALSAPAFGTWFALRTSFWLLPLDLLAAGALLMLAASYANGGTVLDLSVPRALVHLGRATVNAVLAPTYLLEGGGSGERRAAILRGVLLALPLAVLVGTLLASADAVFASAFRFDWGELGPRAFAIVLGAWGMAALLRLASVEAPRDIQTYRPRLGATEWTIVLGSLDVLLAGFAIARVLALTEGGRRVIETAGLTYAEYARSGFFQLLAATIVSLGTLLVLRPLAEPAGRRRFVVMAEIAIALLVLVVVQALQRLALYERAFGLTMPRLVATAACVGTGLVLVAAGLWFGGVAAHRHWFWAAAGGIALGLLLTLNAINPEGLVVGRNAARAQETGKFDAGELRYLGSDAVPALVRALPGLPVDARSEAEAWLCGSGGGRDSGIFSYNLGQAAAVEARDRVCAEPR